MSLRQRVDALPAVALEELQTARILLIDDDPTMLSLYERTLRLAGALQVRSVCDPFGAVAAYKEFEPDIVLLDVRMPPLDGFVVMEQFRAVDTAGRLVPVIMVTDDASPMAKKQALEAGVSDFLNKDLEDTEMLLRIRNVLRIQQLYRQVQRQKGWLEETVRIRTRQLFAARREVLERLALAAEFRDDETGEHTRRVGQLSAQIAQRMSQEAAFVESIGTAALLHDLGKIGVPDTILLKPGKLTSEEYEVMKAHTRIGASILADCHEPVMRMAHEVALTHHERWDGRGYPQGLAGEEIPLCGRIVAVADAFDAMTSTRPYKGPMTVEAAVIEIIACHGQQFDPKVVEAFLEVVYCQSPETLATISPQGLLTQQPALDGL